MARFDGRIALVTGSSRGIGAAIALALAREGARVALHGRDREALEATRRAITAGGGAAAAFTAELTSSVQIEEMRLAVEARFGPVELLVANAGGSPTPPGPLESIEETEWRAAVEMNLTVTFLTIKSFLPGMKSRGRGTIITLSSSSGRIANAMSPLPYASAKAGIEMLTRNLALQNGRSGIRVNCIAPGAILTERNRERIPDAQKESIARWHPLQRLGTPEDVAEAALYLASQSAAWITGVVLDVAGGSVIV